MVDDMVELHDHLGGRPGIWVGHDWGSPVAGALAAHHGVRSRGLVLLSVAYYPEGFALPVLGLTGSFIPLIDILTGSGTTSAFTRPTSMIRSATSTLTFWQLASVYRRGNPAAVGEVSPTAKVTLTGGATAKRIAPRRHSPMTHSGHPLISAYWSKHSRPTVFGRPMHGI
jgi:pimeloyl-ACP methyl ester carboxylesterase